MKKFLEKIKEFKKIYLIGAFVLLILFVSLALNMRNTHATYGDKMYGYAWSENIGWISFNNCIDPAVSGTCSGKDYGVSYNPSTGALTGYAWSSNIGWIQFGGLSGFPAATVANGTTAANATLGLSGANVGKITGWARALSVTATNDGACPNSDLDNDGCWDGWISFSGTGYSTVFNGNTGLPDSTNHFGWGSNILGWIDFSQTKITPPITVGSASVDSFSGPSCVMLSPQNKATLTWTTTGMTRCDLMKNGAVLSSNVSLNNTTGTEVTVNVPSSTFQLLCCAENPGTCSNSPVTNNTGALYPSGTLVITSQVNCQPTVVNKKPTIIER